ncbi:LacI family DNA-binding transcriptional regulator, partial [Rhizobium johnstonii]|uniref:LacI family DNA-binding transcriptional regulator n=1 Tax=Rhizobium johnstonii TaxID=3019933 RepID=UPI003F952F91
PMTVSRVLNDRGGASADTIQRIILAASELHYRPNPFARGLRSDRSKAIGLLFPDITNPFFPEVISDTPAARATSAMVILDSGS